MAENIKTGQDKQKQGQPEKPVGNVGTPGNRDMSGDPNKNKMSPGIGTDRKGQGQGNQGTPGGQGQGVSNPNKMSPDKDRVSQGNDLDDDDRATQRTQRPNLDRDDQK